MGPILGPIVVVIVVVAVIAVVSSSSLSWRCYTFVITSSTSTSATTTTTTTITTDGLACLFEPFTIGLRRCKMCFYCRTVAAIQQDVSSYSPISVCVCVKY